MDEADITINENDAPEVDQDHQDRLLPQSSRRHSAATWLNCACSPDAVQKPTFTCVLKCVFVFVLLLSMLSNLLLEVLPRADHPDWVTWKLLMMSTGWKMNIVILVFVAVIYVGWFLTKLKKTTSSASRRTDEVPTISASIQV